MRVCPFSGIVKTDKEPSSLEYIRKRIRHHARTDGPGGALFGMPHTEMAEAILYLWETLEERSRQENM